MIDNAQTQTFTPALDPAAFLRSQLVEPTSRTDYPEMRLIAAILEDALESVLRYAGAPRGARRRRFIEARSWLLDDRRDWPFAFANVCDFLGLDTAAVRQFAAAAVSPCRVGAADDPGLPRSDAFSANTLE